MLLNKDPGNISEKMESEMHHDLGLKKVIV